MQSENHTNFVQFYTKGRGERPCEPANVPDCPSTPGAPGTAAPYQQESAVQDPVDSELSQNHTNFVQFYTKGRGERPCEPANVPDCASTPGAPGTASPYQQETAIQDPVDSELSSNHTNFVQFYTTGERPCEPANVPDCASTPGAPGTALPYQQETTQSTLNSQHSTHNSLWHRQPNEPAPDYQLFTDWLQLPTPRKFTKAAKSLGCSVHRLRRLSAQHDWHARTAAFDNYRADATSRALDQLLNQEEFDWKNRAAQFRLAEWALYEKMVEAASAATGEIRKHPNRVSLYGLATMLELSSRLGRRATGLPLEYDKPKPEPEWRSSVYPSFEEALKIVYGKPLEGEEADDEGGETTAEDRA